MTSHRSPLAEGSGKSRPRGTGGPDATASETTARRLTTPPFIRYRPNLPPAPRRPAGQRLVFGPQLPNLQGSRFASQLPRPSRKAFLFSVALIIGLEIAAFHVWRNASLASMRQPAEVGGQETGRVPGIGQAASRGLAAAQGAPARAIRVSSVGGLTDGIAASSAGEAAISPTDVPAAPPTEPPTPLPTWTPGPEASVPIVPVIDAATKSHLREIHQRGLERGLRPQVFAKVGDSITASPFFLSAFGCPTAALHDHADLAPVIEFFRQVELPGPSADAPCPIGNSFTRASLAAGIGWSASQVLAPLPDPPGDCAPPDDTPLRCELRQIQPAIAIVMFGTNEAYQRTSPAAFRSALGAVLDELVALGVLPLVSTLPPQHTYAGRWLPLYNGLILELASERRVPVVNYWRALHELATPSDGLAPDGIHPSAYGHGGSLGPYGLRFGYNVRNLVTLQALAKLKSIVLDDGPPD